MALDSARRGPPSGILDLRNDNLSAHGADIGVAVDRLFLRWAESNPDACEHYTAPSLIQMAVGVVAHQTRWDQGPAIHACGSGGFLVACGRRMLQAGDPRPQLFGQDINRGTCAIAKLRLALDEFWDARIEVGEIPLTNPRLLERGQLVICDVAISSPPFGAQWNIESAEHDPFRRFLRGVPTRSRSELAFLLHMLSTISENGRALVVTTHGVLFRGGTERQIRRELIREDLIEAIIGLPENLYFNTSITSVMLLLNRGRKRQPKQMLFVDAAAGSRARGRP